MKHTLISAVVVVATALQCAGEASPRKTPHLGAIVGFYKTNDARTPYKTLRVRLLRAYKHDGFEQGDFSGVIGGQPLVGQAIISGDEGYMEDFVRFDFMYLNPQDTTSLVQAQSIMRNGRAVGLKLQDNGVTFIYNRVTDK